MIVDANNAHKHMSSKNYTKQSQIDKSSAYQFTFIMNIIYEFEKVS